MPATKVYVSQCLVQTLVNGGQINQHAMAVSTILAIKLFQARRDTGIASKILMDHCSQELRNAPIYSQQLFDNKIKEVAKSNFEVQQHRFWLLPLIIQIYYNKIIIFGNGSV